MVELAWLWLQDQPTSALTLWFHERAQTRCPVRIVLLPWTARVWGTVYRRDTVRSNRNIPWSSVEQGGQDVHWLGA